MKNRRDADTNEYARKAMQLFDDAIYCNGCACIPGTETRVRTVVAAMMRARGSAEMQPLVGRLNYIAGRLEAGLPIPKKTLQKISESMWWELAILYLGTYEILSPDKGQLTKDN